jgi:hypothetical protein
MFIYFALASRLWRFSDGWNYAMVLRQVHALNVLSIDEIWLELMRGRFAYPAWLMLLLLIKEVSGVNLTDAYWFHLIPVFAICAIFSEYTLVRTLVRNTSLSLFITIIQVIYYFTSLYKDEHGRLFDGGTLLQRIHEDKVFAVWVVVPVALALALRFWATRNLRYLVGFVITAAGATLIHPLGFIILSVALGGIMLVCCITSWRTTHAQRRQFLFPMPLWFDTDKAEQKSAWRQLLVQASVFLVIFLLLLIPLGQRQALVAIDSIADNLTLR